MSCQPSGDQKTTKQVGKSPENLLTIVPQKANLHAEPNLESPVLESFGKGEFVIWEGKESDQKETQVVNSEELNAYWFEVRSKQGQVGWMWAGNLSNAPNAQVDAPGQIVFSDFLASLDAANPDATRSAIVHFKKVFPASNAAASDEAFQALQTFFIASADSMNMKLFEPPLSEQLMEFEDGQGLDEQAQKFRANLLRSGFLIRVSEGTPYIEASPKYLLDNLKNYLSEPMKTFQTQLIQESNQGLLEDAGLVIPLNTLAERIRWKENFINQHPNFIYRKEIEALKTTELGLLLLGVDNTPAFDFETGIYQTDRKDLLEHLQRSYPDAPSSQTIGQFLDLLEQANNVHTESLDQFVEQIYQ
ncbi:MAG: SH3 domain-containing protein [Bacteroidota bacterium]